MLHQGWRPPGSEEGRHVNEGIKNRKTGRMMLCRLEKAFPVAEGIGTIFNRLLNALDMELLPA